MTSLNIIENKISDIRKYLNILDKYSDITAEQLEQNFELSGSVERYLYLVTQASIDLAESVIAYKSLRKPRFYKEAFDILREENLLDADLAKSLKEMAGFRNVLAHDYAEIDYQKVSKVLQGDFKDIKDFVKIAIGIR